MKYVIQSTYGVQYLEYWCDSHGGYLDSNLYNAKQYNSEKEAEKDIAKVVNKVAFPESREKYLNGMIIVPLDNKQLKEGLEQLDNEVRSFSELIDRVNAINFSKSSIQSDYKELNKYCKENGIFCKLEETAQYPFKHYRISLSCMPNDKEMVDKQLEDLKQFITDELDLDYKFTDIKQGQYKDDKSTVYWKFNIYPIKHIADKDKDKIKQVLENISEKFSGRNRKYGMSFDELGKLTDRLSKVCTRIASTYITTYFKKASNEIDDKAESIVYELEHYVGKRIPKRVINRLADDMEETIMYWVK